MYQVPTGGANCLSILANAVLKELKQGGFYTARRAMSKMAISWCRNLRDLIWKRNSSMCYMLCHSILSP